MDETKLEPEIAGRKHRLPEAVTDRKEMLKANSGQQTVNNKQWQTADGK